MEKTGNRLIFVFCLVILLLTSPAAAMKWQQMSSPVSGDIAGIWANSPVDVFAVTTDCQVIHYNGKTWQITTQLKADHPALPADHKNEARAIWGRGPEDVFVAGISVLFHFNGSDWIQLQKAATRSVTFNTISGSGSENIIAAGSDNSLFECQNLFFSNYKGKWQSIKTTTCNREFISAWSDSPANIYLIGREQGQTFSTLTWFNGREWTQLFGIDMMPGKNKRALFKKQLSLESIWGFKREVLFAVGSGGFIVQIIQPSGTIIVSDSPTTLDLYSISGTGVNEIFAAGSEGVILRYNGHSWKVMSSPTFTTLTTVYADPSAGVYVGGKGGVILRLQRD